MQVISGLQFQRLSLQVFGPIALGLWLHIIVYAGAKLLISCPASQERKRKRPGPHSPLWWNASNDLKTSRQAPPLSSHHRPVAPNWNQTFNTGAFGEHSRFKLRQCI